jgi:hypothetical protein
MNETDSDFYSEFLIIVNDNKRLLSPLNQRNYQLPKVWAALVVVLQTFFFILGDLYKTNLLRHEKMFIFMNFYEEPKLTLKLHKILLLEILKQDLGRSYNS